jgi:3,4-dihydroxy 2-butanone 4-phosphate synthase / GTP cyclohydrolase II
MALNTIDEAVAAIAAGEMIIVVDDEDRENEGDLVMAAEKATPEQVAFMIRHTSGILCTPMTGDEARRLHLDPMVAVNDAPHETAFTVSVDVRHGLTTGISAEERTNTVRALANKNSGAVDFVRPGHIFPLVSKPGGVLVRSGHTEASTDLATLAGLNPTGLLAELVNDNGSVKRLPEILPFAAEHGLMVISIADLIEHRQRAERLVSRIADFSVDVPTGGARCCVYRTEIDDTLHYALCFGDLAAEPVLVRIQRAGVLSDVFGVDGGQGDLVRRSMDRLGRDGGVLVYLRDGTGYVGNPPWIGEDGLPIDPDASVDEDSSHNSRRQQWRDVGLGAQILLDLKVTAIDLLATSDRHYVGLEGYGIEIAHTTMLD